MLIDITLIRVVDPVAYGTKGVHKFEYQITDSEFGVIRCIGSTSCMNADGSMVGRADVIITEYTKRGLNVAANLAKMLTLYIIAHKEANVQALIQACEDLQPMFAQYKDELTKYLALM